MKITNTMRFRYLKKKRDFLSWAVLSWLIEDGVRKSWGIVRIVDTAIECELLTKRKLS